MHGNSNLSMMREKAKLLMNSKFKHSFNEDFPDFFQVWFKNRRAKFRKDQRRHIASEREHRSSLQNEDEPTYMTPMYYPPSHGHMTHTAIPHYWSPSVHSEWTTEPSMLPVSGTCYGHAHAQITSTPVPANTIHVPEVTYGNLVLQRAHAHREDMWNSYPAMF
jgi:hypothetical protein